MIEAMIFKSALVSTMNNANTVVVDLIQRELNALSRVDIAETYAKEVHKKLDDALKRLEAAEG